MIATADVGPPKTSNFLPKQSGIYIYIYNNIYIYIYIYIYGTFLLKETSVGAGACLFMLPDVFVRQVFPSYGWGVR
jgi:hypothetical protein